MKLKLLVSIAALLVATACSRTAPRQSGTENVDPNQELEEARDGSGEIAELGIEAVVAGLDARTLVAVDANGGRCAWTVRQHPELDPAHKLRRLRGV